MGMESTGSVWPTELTSPCCVMHDMNESDTVRVFEVALQNGSSKRNPQFVGVELLQSFKLLIIPCYTVVALVGVFGNYLLLYVIDLLHSQDAQCHQLFYWKPGLF